MNSVEGRCKRGNHENENTVVYTYSPRFTLVAFPAPDYGLYTGIRITTWINNSVIFILPRVL